MKLHIQSALFVLICLIVTLQPVEAKVTPSQRVQLYGIQSCLILGRITNDPDMIGIWNDKLIKFNEKNQMTKKEYNDIVRFTHDSLDRASDSDLNDIYSFCLITNYHL